MAASIRPPETLTCPWGDLPADLDRLLAAAVRAGADRVAAICGAPVLFVFGDASRAVAPREVSDAELTAIMERRCHIGRVSFKAFPLDTYKRPYVAKLGKGSSALFEAAVSADRVVFTLVGRPTAGRASE
jgi:hypothetical protein